MKNTKLDIFFLAIRQRALCNANGVYFIHILIVSLLVWNMNFDGWARSLKLLFLEGVSVGGSILLIALFSGIPFCRRRMFGIKG